MIVLAVVSLFEGEFDIYSSTNVPEEVTTADNASFQFYGAP